MRIRRRGNYLATTFKGARLDKETKTLKSRVDACRRRAGRYRGTTRRVDQARDDWIRFYERLGFAQYGRVVKTRRRAEAVFEGRRVEITLDVIDGLGSFTELEVMAEKSDFAAAKTDVMVLAASLGLRETILQSYLSMVCAKDQYLCSCDAK